MPYTEAMMGWNDQAEISEGELLDLRRGLAASRREVERLTTEMDALRQAALGVCSHMEGRQPVWGWLRDSNESRDALDALVRAAETVRG